MSDVLGAELGGIFLLLETGDGGETREDFAGIDEHDADVVLAELVAPAFRHAAKREFAGVVRRAPCRALQAGGRGDVDDVAALPRDELLRGAGFSALGKPPGLCRGLLLIRQDPAYRLTWTLVPPAPGPLMRAPSPLETTLTQSESLPL